MILLGQGNESILKTACISIGLGNYEKQTELICQSHVPRHSLLLSRNVQTIQCFIFLMTSDICQTLKWEISSSYISKVKCVCYRNHMIRGQRVLGLGQNPGSAHCELTLSPYAVRERTTWFKFLFIDNSSMGFKIHCSK